MSTQQAESRIDDGPVIISNPGSPAASSKPGSPPFSSSRHSHSSWGGTTGSSKTSSAGGYAGGYATRHTLTQLSAAVAIAAASAADSPASRGSSDGRSIHASRRASMNERPSQQQSHHHRNASHGTEDMTVHGFASPPDKPEKARGLFYSRMLSYGKRAATPAATAAGHMQRQSQQLAEESSDSSVPELVLVGGDHSGFEPGTIDSSAGKLQCPMPLGLPAPAAVAAALHGDAAAAAALVGMQTSLDCYAAAAAAEVAAAIMKSQGEVMLTGIAADFDSHHTAAAAGCYHAAQAAAGRSSQPDRSDAPSAGVDLKQCSSKQLNTEAAAWAVDAIPGVCDSTKDANPYGSSMTVVAPSASVNGADDEVGSSSKAGSKPSTPTERARALARAALDALQPRKGRKISQEGQFGEGSSTAGLSKRQRKKAAAVLAVKNAEAVAAAAAAAATEAEPPPSAAVQDDSYSSALEHKPTTVAAAKPAVTTAALSTETLQAMAVECLASPAALNSAEATAEHVAAAATKESKREQRSTKTTPRASKQGPTACSPASSRLWTQCAAHNEEQVHDTAGNASVEPAASSFSVGGDVEDTERAVSLRLAEFGDFSRARAEDGNAGRAAATSVAVAAGAIGTGAVEDTAADAASVEAGGSAIVGSGMPDVVVPSTVNISNCGLGGSVASSAGGTSASVTSSAGGTSASVTSSAGGTSASVTSSAGGTSASVTSSAGGTSASVTSSAGGTSASVTSSAGGPSASVTSSAGGTSASVTSSAGGTPASVTSSAGGTSASVTSSAGGTSASVTSSAGGTSASVTSSAGGTSASVTSSAGGTPASVTSSAGGTSASATSSAGGTPASVTSSAGGASASVTSSAGGPSASVTSSAGGPSASVTSSGDYRYCELIFRLQQFLPALKASAASISDNFEETWELIKCELTALVNTAKLAHLQTGKLEALDAEVAQLQKLLVRVGQSIKAGAQQQQLRDLFHSFPSFARRQLMEQSTGSSNELSSAAPTVAAAAAAAAASTGFKPLAQAVALTLVNHSKYPHSSRDSGRWSNGLDTDGSTWSQGWSTASCSGSETTMGSSSGGGSATAGQQGSPLRGCLLNGTLPANQGHSGQQQMGHDSSSSTVRRSCGVLPEVSEDVECGAKGAASPPAPPHKVLTVEESEKLASLYRVVGDKPQRIFYKELKLAHHKSYGGAHSRYSDSGSPAASPSCQSAAASPATTAGDAAATSWKHVVSPEPPAATPLPAAEDAAEQQQQQQQQHQEDSEEQQAASSHAVCSSKDLACDPVYSSCAIAALSVHAIPCSAGHAYIGSGLPSSAARSSLSNAVPKGFRVLRAVPEAHKKQQAGGGQGGLRSPKSMRDVSPGQHRSHSTPPELRASADSPMYTHSQLSRSPDRSATAYQCRRVTSPLRHSLAQTQFSEQRHPRQQRQRPSELQAPLSWSYPRGRDARIRASREGSFELHPGTGTMTATRMLPDPHARARSTSPSLGMHYLERSGLGASSRAKTSAASVRSSYCIGAGGRTANAAAHRNNVGPGSWANGALRSPTKGAAAVPVVAEDFRFSAACKAFMQEHTSAVAAEGLSPKACGNDSLGGAKLAARLSPIKDADSTQIDAAMRRLVATMQSHSVNLELSRLGPCLYSAAGRKLRIRMLNGNLLVRTGGGHESLLGALGKLPLSTIDGSSGSASTGALAFGQPTGGSHHQYGVDDSCYANLAVEAAVAAAAVAAGDGYSNNPEQTASAVAQEGVAVSSDDDAVAVVQLGTGSGFATQCAAVKGNACSGDAAWLAIAEEAAEPFTNFMLHSTQQPAVPAAAQEAAV